MLTKQYWLFILEIIVNMFIITLDISHPNRSSLYFVSYNEKMIECSLYSRLDIYLATTY